MDLSDIAADAGTITQSQKTREIRTVDATDRPLIDHLESVDAQLPCTPAEAATVVQSYGNGSSVGAAALDAGIAPITAAKTLHRLGIPGMTPVSPSGRRIIRDWLDGRITRHEAERLADVADAEFALAAYIETHAPIDDVVPVVERELAKTACARSTT